jgi:hypothetical protein
MGVTYSLGKGFRDPCFPYLYVQVFGAPAGSISPTQPFNCAPEIVFEGQEFDLSVISPGQLCAVALAVFTDFPGGQSVDFKWYRLRDSELIHSDSYTIPSREGGASWGWYWVASYIAYGPGAVDENTTYYLQITSMGEETAEILFWTKGIPAAAPPQPAGVQLPAAVRSALDSGWCNLGAGEWGSFLGVNLPPWGLEPGREALKAIDFILNAVNDVITRAEVIWGKAYNAALTAGNALSKIDDWLSYAANWWNSLITSWWSGAQEWVKVWVQDKFNTLWAFIQSAGRDINNLYSKNQNLTDTTKSWQTWLLGSLASISPIDTLIAGYNKMESFYSVYLTQIGDFFRDPPGWIFDRIDDWLNERVS